MGQTENTLAVAPPLLTVRVLLAGSNIPVKGLFIAFKLKPPAKKDDPPAEKKEDEKTAKINRLIETLRDDDFKKIRDNTPAKERNDKWEARYSRILAQYQAQLAETIADPADRFVLGFTDIDGYLEPVYDSSNPWRDRLARLEPDTFKFALGETYLALYIRHPSPDLARSLTRALNGLPPGRPDIDFKNTALWGEPGPALQSFTVEAGSGNEGEQFIIQVPAYPKAYVPRRTDDPNLWWLYAGMPHDNIDTVRHQVDHLASRLGILKFPATGDQDFPYSKEVNVFHGALHASTARFQEILEGNTAFQPAAWGQASNRDSWASEIGDVVKIDPAPVPRLEQGGVVGPYTDAKIELWMKNKWIKPGEHLITVGFDPPPGVKMPRYEVLMLGRGAFAFNAWGSLAKALGGCYGVNSGHSYRSITAEGGGGAIKNSVHKTGLAVDLTGGRRRTTLPTWPVRFEAEFRRVKQKVTLAQLEETLAAKEAALKTATTNRETDRQTATQKLADATAARQLLDAPPADPKKKPTKSQISTADAKVKSAKTALDGIDKKHKPAIDKATRERDTAQANVDAMKEAIRNDSDRLPSRWTMRFRLYGHSYADVFSSDPNTRQAARAALKPAIARWAGIPYTPDQSPPTNTGGVDGEFFQFILSTYCKGVPTEMVAPWFVNQFQYAFAFANKLLTLSDNEIVDQFFRETITQWRANFYERDGGTDNMTPWRAHEGDADFPVWPTAKSWINLSAIGHGCQLHRIPPHSMDCRDKLSFSTSKSKLPPMAFPMANYLKFEKEKAEQGDLVAAIEDITASAAKAPQLAHKDFVLQFGFPTGNNKNIDLDVEALPAEVDTAFFKSWRTKIFGLSTKQGVVVHLPGSRAVYRPEGACISIEIHPDRLNGLEPALDMLTESFPARDFLIQESGSLVQPDLPDDAILSGTQLRAAIEKALARLTAKLTAERQKAAQDAKDEAERIAAEKEAAKKAKKKYVPSKKAAVTVPPPTKVEDWSILIQPVFSFPPKAQPPLQLPPRKILFIPKHTVLLPPRENAAHLEWWHYQHHSVKTAGKWRVILEECGFSTTVMGTPIEGEPLPAGEPIHFGLGYSTAELDSHPWPSESEINTQPPNRDTGLEEAIEDDPENVIE